MRNIIITPFVLGFKLKMNIFVVQFVDLVGETEGKASGHFLKVPCI